MSAPGTPQDARITDLEVKVAFQEKLLGELDEVIRSMRDEIDHLRDELRRFEERLPPEAGPTPDEKPPHY